MKENYDCGVVRTKKAWTTGEELFTQKYGYFETRAKLPKNISADYWAAFWMLSGDFSDK
jgi:beta-glucanase (GH16 family)